MADAASYKQRKEAFVSNLSGGSVAEVGLVTSVAPASGLGLFPPARAHTPLFFDLPTFFGGS